MDYKVVVRLRDELSRAIAILFSLILFSFQVKARAECSAEEGQRVGTVYGRVVDARNFPHSAEQFSKQDDETLHMVEKFGPYLILIEDGTNKIRPFYGAAGDYPVREVPLKNAQYINHHVKATGCISDGDWPSVLDAEIEIID